MIGPMRRLYLADADEAQRRTVTTRSAVPDPGVLAGAAAIVADVASGGDEAVARLSARHGGALADGSVTVPAADIAAAVEALDPGLRAALDRAIGNVRTVHTPQRPIDASVEPMAGVIVERRWTPLGSVGVYVPGGRGVYPSSLIMGVVPARIAGVRRIVVATPARPDGRIDPVVLATAGILGVDEVVAMGGAQAVAALAHGTATIAPVDKIVGPGGPWVTAAKLLVSGTCGVDLPAGPSEAAIVADGHGDAAVVAADVMCQAEHGAESSVLLACTSDDVADVVEEEIARRLPHLDRRDVIASALMKHGLIAIAEDLADLLAFVDAWAPEHLSIHTSDPSADAAAITNAGSVFVGRWTPEAAGDYATGANHVLPTGGLARAYGPLGVEDFGSWRQVQTLTEEGLASLGPTIVELARAEGFTAHAHSVTTRMERPR